MEYMKLKNQLKNEILKTLSETEDYLSGEALAQRYSVSRQTVYKNVLALQQEGYEIDKVRNRGYKLLSQSFYPDPEKLSEAFPAFRFVLSEETDSTNLDAARAYLSGERKPVFFVAKKQTAGRGNRGGVFPSPGGKGLYASALLFPSLTAEELSARSEKICADLAAALGCDRKEQRLFYAGKHAGGILIESICEGDRVGCLIVGIGLYGEALPRGISPVRIVLSVLSKV